MRYNGRIVDAGGYIVIRAVIYVRVSTEEQTKGYSLSLQQDKCIAKAKELGCVDWAIYEDAGVSGEVFNRPALIDAIDRAKADKTVKYFICTHPDRLSRDLSNMLVLTGKIEHRRSNTELVYTDYKREQTPEGQLYYAIQGAVAEFEKANTRRKTMEGKMKKASQHRWTHWPDIYGYDYAEGVVTVNESEAKFVRLIFEYAARMGVNSICLRLEEMGIPSPRGSMVWSRTTVKRIIENESYATGTTHLRKWNKEGVYNNKWVESEEDKIQPTLRDRSEWIPIPIPAIVAREAWIAANRRRQNARRRTDNNTEHDFLLSGLLRCGHCGKTWHGFSTMRRGYRAPYYVCTYKSPGPTKGLGIERCPTHFVPANVLDDEVWGVVSKWLRDDDAVMEFNAAQLAPPQSDSRATEIEALHERRMQLGGEQDSIVRELRRATNERVRDRLMEELVRIADELGAVVGRIGELTPGTDEMPGVLDREIISTLRITYSDPERASLEDKRALIRELINEIVVNNEGREITLRYRPRNAKLC